MYGYRGLRGFVNSAAHAHPGLTKLRAFSRSIGLAVREAPLAPVGPAKGINPCLMQASANHRISDASGPHVAADVGKSM